MNSLRISRVYGLPSNDAKAYQRSADRYRKLLAKELIKEDVSLEICPTSNLHEILQVIFRNITNQRSYRVYEKSKQKLSDFIVPDSALGDDAFLALKDLVLGPINKHLGELTLYVGVSC
jgi:hypothetical protein